MDPDLLDTLSRVPHGGATDAHLLDFSANTNPVSPPGVAPVYESALSVSRRYPADDYCEFRTAAAEYIGCRPREVIPTAGGLAGMRLVFSLCVHAGDSVLVPAPSFGEYAHEARVQGGEPVFVSHDELLGADPSDHALAVVCTPNNPTGETYAIEALHGFAERCRAAGTTLLVDEAFLDFTDQPSVAGMDGVVVARSLTKIFGLPGLRSGFLVATGDLYERLAVARPAWNLSTPAAAVGAYCLRQFDFIDETKARVEAERRRMHERLGTRYDVFPSEAPFLLFDVGSRSVETIVDRARERGVAVRDARTFRGLDSHIRVAVKRPKENDALLEALDV
ncbi:threonine-phosphate decarboxylase CobD [Haloferacaceae archaeon DSL9]